MAITNIQKRDGRIVPFDEQKITSAISLAFLATKTPDEDTAAPSLTREVVAMLELEAEGTPTVEHIQDLVELALMRGGYAPAAKAYILYRERRNRARQMNTRLMQKYEEITFSDARNSDIKRENANIDGDTAMGTMLRYGSEGSKQFHQMFVMNPDFAHAHENGDIHIHDMDFYWTTTCCQIDILKLFHGGFNTGHGKLREPNDIMSYAALACIAIQSNQNDQHGGQSIVNFDYGMAEGVRKTFRKRYWLNLQRALELLDHCTMDEGKWKQVQKDLLSRGLSPALTMPASYLAAEAKALQRLFNLDLPEITKSQAFAAKHATAETEQACHQAMESLIHNLNTMQSRAGAQVPFSSINYGMDTSAEARMAIRCLLLATEEGLGDGETPIFPIQILRLKKGVNLNPGDPNYDIFKLACRCSAKRLFPNFSFMDAPFNAQYYKPGHPETEIAYMGCRTRVIGNVADPTREIVNQRGNLSFTSINLPRLAIEAHGDVNAFFQGLDKMLDLCVAQLLERFEYQCRKKAKNFPFLMGQGNWLDSEKLKPDDEVREVLRHGTLSIGFIGLAEALKALTGFHHGESDESQQLGLSIIGHMRERTDRESTIHKLNFTLLATPAEGLSGRFVKIDAARYGHIPGVTDREYYTNSFHVPVYYPISAFRKIQLEAPYHALTNAGHISYVELDGDPLQNLEAFEKIVRYMGECGCGYGSINHPVDRDPVCGYNGIIGDTCPRCGRKETPEQPFDRIRRITGYLVGTLDRFNDAKRAEVRDRVSHTLSAVHPVLPDRQLHLE